MKIYIKSSNNNDWSHRLDLAYNSTSPTILIDLAHDKDREVRLGVARNPNTPKDALEDLTVDDDDRVKYAAQDNLDSRNRYYNLYSNISN